MERRHSEVGFSVVDGGGRGDAHRGEPLLREGAAICVLTVVPDVASPTQGWFGVEEGWTESSKDRLREIGTRMESRKRIRHGRRTL